MPRAPRDPDDDATVTQDGRIDPARLDVVRTKRQRRRKKRDRPEPRQELKDAKAAMEKRLCARPIHPGVMLEPAGFDEERWTPPHADFDLWQMQLGECFGTRSVAVLHTFMRQLEKLCGRNIWDDEAHQWRLDENEFSAILAIISGLKPKNELEAAHAAQMVAIHLLTMKTAARALRYDGDTRTAAVAGKLARTFNSQRDSFERHRKGSRTTRQNIKVSRETHHHQHIHVHREGQNSDGEPQAKDGGHLRSATAEGPEGLPALPSPEEIGRRVVPFPGDAQRPMQNARGGKSGRPAR